MENSILRYLKGCDGELSGRIVRTLKVYRGIDFEDIRQEDVMVVSPDKALEYSGEEGDKYFKVWMAGERIAWCTWANTLVDSHFRWNAQARGENKRDNGDLLGNEPYVSAYLKSYDAVKECSTVYMFPFAAFGKKEEDVEEENVQEEREVVKRREPSVMSGVAKAVKSVLSESKEEIAERMREEREDKAEAKQVMETQLNYTYPKILTKELLELSAKIDAVSVWDFGDSKTGAAQRAKFRSGLMMLKSIDPQNAMIGEMEAMLKKWRIKTMFPFILFFGMMAFFLLMMLLGKLGVIDLD